MSQPQFDDALGALRTYWGYSDFREGQRDAVSAVISGRDVLTVLPTGGGKSLIYQVPPVASQGLALVVSPLVALMHDQVDALSRRGIRAAALHGSLSRAAQDQLWTDAEHGLYRLVYLTPERLQTDLFEARVGRLNIDLLAVDEAHCISEWGHDFRPAYRQIGDIRALVTSASGAMAPVVAVTATATPEVRRDILEHLGLQDPFVLVKGFDRPNLTWSVHRVQDPIRQAIDVFHGVPGPGLVYAGTRRASERVAARLALEGIRAEPYHAGLDPDVRAGVQTRWLDGETRVIAATSAFGMGIDKPDVRAVVHTALPPTLESYYQEAGRAGRDGDGSYAVLAVGPDAETLPRDLVERGHPTPANLQAVYDAVASLSQVAIGSLPEDPCMVDARLVQSVTDLPTGLIGTAIDRLAATGVWSLVPTRSGDIHVRLPSGRDGYRRALEAETPAVQAFGDALLRRLPPETEFGLGLRLDPLAEALGLPSERLRAGMDYLTSRGALAVVDIRDGIALQWNQPRLARAPIDHQALDASRRRAHAKLDTVVGYVQAIGCRRQYLLAYFGEPSPARCGRCDVCLGRHQLAVVTPDDESELDAILLALSQGKDVQVNRRQRELMQWLVAEGLIRLAEPLAGRYELTPAGQRRVAATA
ncbi:MAG: ATP-dependent DNA helicase RecQ [Bacteroidota bacterium]